MSSLAISSNPTAAMAAAAISSHRHGSHGTRADTESLLTVGEPGQLPVSVAQSLHQGVQAKYQLPLAPAGGASSSILGSILNTQA